jgi:hypothetical protein
MQCSLVTILQSEKNALNQNPSQPHENIAHRTGHRSLQVGSFAVRLKQLNQFPVIDGVFDFSDSIGGIRARSEAPSPLHVFPPDELQSFFPVMTFVLNHSENCRNGFNAYIELCRVGLSHSLKFFSMISLKA